MDLYKENIINFDFEGWPEVKMTVRELLDSLGVYDYKVKNEKILDSYPVVLVDDGMGYGVDKQYICEASYNEDGFVTIFREKEIPNIKEYLELGVYPGQVVEFNGSNWYVCNIYKNGKVVLLEEDVDKMIDDNQDSVEHNKKELSFEEFEKLFKGKNRN